MVHRDDPGPIGVSPGLHCRTASILVLGALALHEIRYRLAYGPEASGALHTHGHSYLLDALPVLIALAAALLVASVAIPAPGTGSASGPRGAFRRALPFATALLAVFWAQELAEGLLAPGHPSGLNAIFDGGAWLAVPLALALGGGAAAIARLSDRVVDRVARALVHTPAVRFLTPPARFATSQLATPTRPLAFGISRRGPPR